MSFLVHAYMAQLIAWQAGFTGAYTCGTCVAIMNTCTLGPPACSEVIVSISYAFKTAYNALEQCSRILLIMVCSYHASYSIYHA